ncbi:MAG: glycosyltransferase [Lachnospiraceae bacterium]|nr:glycosyltransferase [Lachnospiraceae bacterium]
MVKNDLVTVLLPVYNGEKFIIDMLDSIERQNYRPMQIIIGDDASSDRSVGLCEQWKSKNESDDLQIVHLIREENVGLSQNIANMRTKIKGKYVFLADQDDVWLEQKVEKQVNYLKQHPECQICLCDRSVVNERCNLLLSSVYEYSGYRKTMMLFDEVVNMRAIFAANCMAIRNGEHFQEYLNIPKELVSHDTFIAYMASYYGTIDFMFEPLLLYRIHPNSLSGNYQVEVSKNVIEAFRYYWRHYKRVLECGRKDGYILKEEIAKRYGIDSTHVANKLLLDKTTRCRIVWSIKQTKKALETGKIGRFLK